MYPPDPEPCAECWILYGEMMECSGACRSIPPTAMEQLFKLRNQAIDLARLVRTLETANGALEAEVSIVRTAKERAV